MDSNKVRPIDSKRVSVLQRLVKKTPSPVITQKVGADATGRLSPRLISGGIPVRGRNLGFRVAEVLGNHPGVQLKGVGGRLPESPRNVI